MTVFIVTTNKDNQGGTNLGFDVKSDFGSPTDVEIHLLREYLTPKAIDLLQDILAKQMEQIGGPNNEQRLK